MLIFVWIAIGWPTCSRYTVPDEKPPPPPKQEPPPPAVTTLPPPPKTEGERGTRARVGDKAKTLEEGTKNAVAKEDKKKSKKGKGKK